MTAPSGIARASFAARRSGADALAERRAARSAQLLVDKDRLIRHQRWAIELLRMPKAQREQILRRARAEVARWRRLRLCTPDDADRWDDLLGQPLEQLVRATARDEPGESAALRQNSLRPVAMG